MIKKFHNNNLLQIWITKLRDKNSSPTDLQIALDNIINLMSGDIFKKVNLKSVSGESPISSFQGAGLNEFVFVCTILRAAENMAPAFKKFLPNSHHIHMGVSRGNMEWNCYYDGLKNILKKNFQIKNRLQEQNTVFYVLDIMFATGNSVFKVFEILKSYGIAEEKIVFVTILGTTIAIAKIKKLYPKINVFIAQVDEILNSKNYIVPGMGDAGDRFFNT